MAMNVQFLKGQSSKFSTITKVDTTFYYLEDTKELYLGSKLLSNEITAEQFAALEGRIKSLEDWRASLTELLKDNGVNDLIKVTVATEAGAIKSVVVDDAALDQKLADDLAEAKQHTDNKIGTLKIENTEYSTVVDYVVAKTTGIATDSVVQGKADKVAPETAGNIAVLTADGNLSDGGESIQDVKDYAQGLINDLDVTVSGHNMAVSGENAIPGTGIIVSVTQEDGKLSEITVSGNFDEKYDSKGANSFALQNACKYTDDQIEGLEFELSETGKELSLKNKAGNVVAVVDTTEFVVDGFLTRVEADQANNKLTFYWNTDSGEQKTEIELSSIADIYTGKENRDGITINVSNTNEISATVGDLFNGRIVDGETAYGWGNHAEAGYLKAGDISGKEDKNNLKALAYKDTIDAASLINDKVITKGKLEESVQTSLGKADTAVQPNTSPTFYRITSTEVAVLKEVIIDGGKLDITGGAITHNPDGNGEEFVVLNMPTQAGSYTIATTADVLAVQGATTNTVQDCVDAINALNAGNAKTNKDINAISTSVSDVVNQLTWGEF